MKVVETLAKRPETETAKEKVESQENSLLYTYSSQKN